MTPILTEYSEIGLKMTIKLNKEIYSLEHIRHAIMDFSALSTVVLSEEEKYYVCVFSECRYEEQLTAKEFINYITDLMNHKDS